MPFIECIISAIFIKKNNNSDNSSNNKNKIISMYLTEVKSKTMDGLCVNRVIV